MHLPRKPLLKEGQKKLKRIIIQGQEITILTVIKLKKAQEFIKWASQREKKLFLLLKNNYLVQVCMSHQVNLVKTRQFTQFKVKDKKLEETQHQDLVNIMPRIPSQKTKVNLTKLEQLIDNPLLIKIQFLNLGQVIMGTLINLVKIPKVSPLEVNKNKDMRHLVQGLEFTILHKTILKIM